MRLGLRAVLSSAILLAVVACGGDDASVPGGSASADAGGDDGARPPEAGPAGPIHHCATKHLPAWSRSRARFGGAATLNEIMYHPAGDGPEWIEIYNPLAFDFDLSGFRLDGAVHLDFPADTRIPPRGYLVVASRAGVAGALGTFFTGSLPDDGGTVELWNNAGRLMDRVAYDDDAPWPVTADGAGASLAKRDPETASGLAEAWTHSARIGGSPAAANPAPPDVVALALSEVGPAGANGWIELTNRSGTPVTTGGERIRAGTREHVMAPRTLAPGELLVLDAATLGFPLVSGEPLYLVDADGAGVLDGVRIAAVPRARPKDSLDWRYPDLASPGAANAFVTREGVVIHEIMYHAPPVPGADGTLADGALEWIELHNRGTADVDVSGWQLVDAAAFELPARTKLAAGGYMILTSDAALFAATYPGVKAPVLGPFAGGLADGGDRIELRDACGNPVDVVRYSDDGRWPAVTDGGGASLEVRDARADRRAPEAWAASDIASRATWQTLTYEGTAAASPVGPDGQWHELVIGLLDAGEVLLDDVHVTVDPATTPTELVSGGDFEGGAAAFRFLGNHRAAEVIVDPTDAKNHVLRLRATGPTEHMHNHIETTLAGGHAITNGRTYRVSLRARWQGGNNLLNTRLYFNRLARTTALSTVLAPGTPGAPNSRAEANIGPTYRDLRHAPAVPAPGDPVEVSVVAADPDGVASLQLSYAVDGAAASSIKMTDVGGGRYTVKVPGQPAGAVVQFWIEAADARGATAMFPAGGPASRAMWKVDDGQAAKNGLHNLRIVMKATDSAWLFAAPNLMSNDWVGATVVYDERVVTYDAGVRLKGSERGRTTTPRIGFGPRFPAENPFRGILKTVLVDRSGGTGYGQREVFFFQAMNRAGAVPSQYDDLIKILSPRTDLHGPAHLQLARFSDLVLESQFDRGSSGDVFEYELIYYPRTTIDGTPTGLKLPQPDSVVGTSLLDLGLDKEAYRYDFILKTNRWRDDYRGFIRFVRTFGQTGAAFDAQVGDVIDVDQFLRAFAFATLSGATDNYASGAQHNAEFYIRPSDGRALYFPHDLDFLTGPTASFVGSPDLARLITVPARARAYYGHLNDIITTSFNATYMRHWSEQMGALVPGQDFAAHLQYIVDRGNWVRSGAANSIENAMPVVPFTISTNGGAPLSVTTASIDLDGQGWVDIGSIRRSGAAKPLALAWPTASTWRATLPLACGPNVLALEAVDRHATVIGTASITVTRTGAGCP